MLALFEWAQVKGVPYRDFSAARREYRAGMRYRAALAKRDAEARAKLEAEESAVEADRAARRASEAARLHGLNARRAAELQRTDEAVTEGAAREQALAQAEQLSRQAAAERTEAARHAEALRTAELAARRESLEMSQARASTGPTGERKAASIAASMLSTPSAGVGEMLAERIPPRREVRGMFALGEEADAELAGSDDRGEGGTAIAIPELLAPPEPRERAQFVEQYAQSVRGSGAESEDSGAVGRREYPSGTNVRDLGQEPTASGARYETGRDASPSWLGGGLPERGHGTGRPAVRETLQHSRERVAARWYALRGLFDPSAPDDEPADVDQREQTAPLLAIYSVAGGVGKTSLAASLTRALSAQGERVLLVDTTERGILPFYLGARELKSEVVRTFAPPAGSADQPIQLVSYRAGTGQAGQGRGEQVAAKIKRDSTGCSRVIVDVLSAASGTLQELVAAGADVLVPVAPDMNSVISLPSLRRMLIDASGGAGRGVEPAFVLVQFDTSQALQLDVREVLQQQLGDQLLPFSIRRSPVIAEALAEGMTVIDYAPGDGIAKEYLQLAAWVRSMAEPAREGLAKARWSER